MKTAAHFSFPNTYQAAVLPEAGKSLNIEEKPFSELQKGEVWVQIKASPINPSDLAMLDGTYPTKKLFPLVPGLEASGIVVASGGGFMANFLLGKRVACSAPETGDGTWAEYMKVPAGKCIPLIKNISFEQGASAIVNPITAMALIERVKASGSKAFVNTAAAGALGKMIVKLAKNEGLVAINIVHRPGLVDVLKSHGVEHVLDSSQESFPEDLRKLCNSQNPKIILDAVGGNFSDVLLEAAPENSTLVAYASLEKDLLHINPAPIIRFGKKIEGFHLAHWVAQQSKLKLIKTSRKVQRLIVDGTLASPIHKTFSLDETNSAVQAYQKEMSKGKWVLRF